MGRCGWLMVLMLSFWVLAEDSRAEPGELLHRRQTILEAHRTLLAAGWMPAPDLNPSPDERAWSAVELLSLSACSGTGAGHCRFDYHRKGHQLSVVTVPSTPGQPSVGRVQRWW